MKKRLPVSWLSDHRIEVLYSRRLVKLFGEDGRYENASEILQRAGYEQASLWAAEPGILPTAKLVPFHVGEVDASQQDPGFDVESAAERLVESWAERTGTKQPKIWITPKTRRVYEQLQVDPRFRSEPLSQSLIFSAIACSRALHQEGRSEFVESMEKLPFLSVPFQIGRYVSDGIHTAICIPFGHWEAMWTVECPHFLYEPEVQKLKSVIFTSCSPIARTAHLLRAIHGYFSRKKMRYELWLPTFDND